ncbi:MAG: ribonuclease P protein component [Propionibacteriaceae bacterium]|nr:ribonuclease P protein component [Propionibacteriaceae bacterium]
MLPRSRRLRRSVDFTETFRRGARAGTPSVVVHVAVAAQNPPGPARVGFVVSKAVGNAVIRNRVKRRLRHLVASRPETTGLDVVVRALPAAAAEPGTLVEDFHSAWERAVRRATC